MDPDGVVVESTSSSILEDPSVSSGRASLVASYFNQWGLTADPQTELDAGLVLAVEQLSDAANEGVVQITQQMTSAPPPPLPPCFRVAAAVQKEVVSQSTPSFIMPTIPVIPPLMTTVASVAPPALYQQFQPQPQFQQPPTLQFYQQMQQQQLNFPHRPAMQMHPSMGQQMGMPYGSAPILIPPIVVGDPMNDMSSWSEHDAEDKRKYWYNRVTGTSTYDKPFCLKTPEERSIPHCKWKEYTSADDKKYYSDGKESRYVSLMQSLRTLHLTFYPTEDKKRFKSRELFLYKLRKDKMLLSS